MTLKLNIRKMIIFLMFFIYPIIPRYFGVAKTSVFKLMCAGIVMLAILFYGIFPLKIKTYKAVAFSIGIWLTVMFLVCTLNGEVSEFLYEVLCYYLPSIILIEFLREKKDFIWAIDLIIGAAAITAVLGIVESFTGFNAFHLLNTMNADIVLQPLRFGTQRIISFTYQTISYCSFCMFALGLIFYRCTLCESNKKKIKFYISYIIVLFAAILTLSRSLLLCILASQLVLLYICGYKVFLRKLFLSMVFIGGIVALLTISFPSVASVLQNLVYMLLAVFNDKYAVALGNVDGTGIGDRADLFSWVWSSVRGHKWLGVGPVTDFSYTYQAKSGVYYYERTKTSIENQYLNLLYHYGIIGLATKVLMYIQLVCQTIKKNVWNGANWETKLTFPKTMFVIFISYFVSFWGVHQIDEKRIFFCCVTLFLAYCRNKRFSGE